MKFTIAATALCATATTAVPTIPQQYTAQVASDVKGDIPGLPKGKSTYTEYYDFANKRRRVDSSDGTTKVYRYDVSDMGHNPFPAPRGYQFQTNNPKLSCCWLWLIDTDDPTNSTNLRMSEIEVSKKATDNGPVTIHGQTAEWWHDKGGIVILENHDDWYFSGNGTSPTLVEHDSQVRLKLKTAQSNLTFNTWDASLIDETIFAVPKADCQECEPFEIGTCKEFGKDPECDMSTYNAVGDDARTAHRMHLRKQREQRIVLVQPKNVAMTVAAATHYGDPLTGACMSDEQNITITGVAGSVCSPAATGGKCPTDTPAGCTITPAAILQDQSGDKYCALECSPSLPIKDQKLADSICGVDNMSCKPISGVGICTYDA
ncbi:hypothetical protein N9362_00030 [bacterium]|nr:hypothetical protein [bacterium]